MLSYGSAVRSEDAYQASEPGPLKPAAPPILGILERAPTVLKDLTDDHG